MNDHQLHLSACHISNLLRLDIDSTLMNDINGRKQDGSSFLLYNSNWLSQELNWRRTKMYFKDLFCIFALTVILSISRVTVSGDERSYDGDPCVSIALSGWSCYRCCRNAGSKRWSEKTTRDKWRIMNAFYEKYFWKGYCPKNSLNSYRLRLSSFLFFISLNSSWEFSAIFYAYNGTHLRLSWDYHRCWPHK